MPLLSATYFQPALPTLFGLLHPHSPWQNPLRLLLLLYTSLIAAPLIFLLAPLSVFLLHPAIQALHPAIPRLAPLPIHPHNLPPHRSLLGALVRAVWVYTVGTGVWAITCCGSPPRTGEAVSRGMAHSARAVIEGLGRCAERYHGSEAVRGFLGCDEGGGEWDTGKKLKERLRVGETRIKPLPVGFGIGAAEMSAEIAGSEVGSKSILGFWLTNHLTLEGGMGSGDDKSSRETSVARAAADVPVDRKVYLFFAGGGYVTGWPLVHPFLFTLARLFPAEEPTFDLTSNSTIHSARTIDDASATMSETRLPRRAIFAPDIRRACDLDTAFPLPVLDALAAYVHLRQLGYAADEIVLMGDSAGAGLVWSVMAFLALWQERSPAVDRDWPGGLFDELGVPSRMIVISPWLSLPPVEESVYPDLVDEPQLLYAATTYLGRYPIVPSPPTGQLTSTTMALLSFDGAERAFQRLLDSVVRVAVILGVPASLIGQRQASADHRPLLTDDKGHSSDTFLLAGMFGGETSDQLDSLRRAKHLDPTAWLSPPLFRNLSTHHPFISPASHSPPLPFVTHILRLLAQNNTKLLVHVGTAEWFHDAAMRFLQAARDGGIETALEEYVGGFHVEAVLAPGELGGPTGRLVRAVRSFVES